MEAPIELSLEQQINIARNQRNIPEIIRLLKLRDQKRRTPARESAQAECNNPIDPFTHVNTSVIKDIVIIDDPEQPDLRWCFDLLPLAKFIFSKPDKPVNPYTTKQLTEEQIHNVLVNAQKLLPAGAASPPVDLTAYQKVPFSNCEQKLFDELNAINKKLPEILQEQDYLLQLYDVKKWIYDDFLRSVNSCRLSKYPIILIKISQKISDYINSVLSIS